LQSKKTIQVELTFQGDGTVTKRNGAFSGGVPAPNLDGNVSFIIHREVPDEDGIWNPIADENTVEGGFQLSIYGNSEGYRELGKYLLALAELDTSADEGFHEHHDDLISLDARTRLHIILRKREVKI
jgi:hypothetical protein